MEDRRMERPRKVTLAVNLLYASLAIGVLRSALETRILLQMASPAFVISVTLATFAVMLFFIIMIAKGRNWARITFLVLFLIGLPLSIHALINAFSTTMTSAIFGIVQVIVNLVALVFLFQQPAADWFKKRG